MKATDYAKMMLKSFDLFYCSVFLVPWKIESVYDSSHIFVAKACYFVFQFYFIWQYNYSYLNLSIQLIVKSDSLEQAYFYYYNKDD